ERKYPGASPVSFEENTQDNWSDKDSIRVAEFWKRSETKKVIVKLSDGMVLDREKYLEMKAALDAGGITVIAERAVKTHKVKQYLLNGHEELEANDWAGKYIPIIEVVGDEININGKRVLSSLIRFAKDPARMHNYWRTVSTELVALAPRAPYVGAAGSFKTDAKKWATINTKNWSHVEYDGNTAPQRQQLDTGGAIGAMQQAMSASDDMKAVMGLHDASLGARSNETSGKAIMARQREGDISTFNFADNLSRAIRAGGKVLIDLIPHYYDTERTIRILNIDETQKSVQINTPFAEKGQTKIYDMSVGKYDVDVKAGPSFTSQREQSAEAMIEMVRSDPNLMQVAGDLIVKAQNWPGADEFAKRLRAMLPPQIQQMEDQEV
ncbi:MAG: portal protein, partial [Shewanella sp.]